MIHNPYYYRPLQNAEPPTRRMQEHLKWKIYITAMGRCFVIWTSQLNNMHVEEV
jgi:hypothetical protein